MIFKDVSADENNIISFKTDNGEKYHNPFLVALQAMIGDEVYDSYDKNSVCLIPKYVNFKTIDYIDDDSRRGAIKWIFDNVQYENESAYWTYDYDATYEDSVLKKGWKSSYAQAYCIWALLYFYYNTRDMKYYNLIIKAANGLTCNIEDGGVCFFLPNKEIWFEEIPGTNCSFIFNAHMAALIALIDIKDVLSIDKYDDMIKRGYNSLIKRMPWLLTGTGTSYAIPRKINLSLMLDFVSGADINFYIKEITATDRKYKECVKLADNDCFIESNAYISGIDWSTELKDGMYRKIVIGRQIRDKEIDGGTIQNTYAFFKNIPIDNKNHIIFTVSYSSTAKAEFVLYKNTPYGYREINRHCRCNIKKGKGVIKIKLKKSCLLEDTLAIYHNYHIDLLRELAVKKKDLNLEKLI